MVNKVKPKLNTYRILSDAIGYGLGFALNRLEDTGVEITEQQRESAIDNMKNEIMMALDEVVDFGD